jgi:enamine deaminase RidA (YjgF/YER057c/UK114 family)
MIVSRLNPDTLHKNPAFTQVVTVTAPEKLIFVGGQNGVNVNGEIVSKEIAGQAGQAYRNVIAALDAAGATLQDVVKMTIYMVQGHSAQEAFGAVQRVHKIPAQPPVISVVIVAGLANPGFLIEIEAVAAVGKGAN